MSEGSLLLPVEARGEEPPGGGPSPLLKRFVPSFGNHWHLRWSWGSQVKQQQKQQFLRGGLLITASSCKAALPSRRTLASTNTSTINNSGSGIELGLSGSRLPSRASLTASSGSNNNSSHTSEQRRLRSFPLPRGGRHFLPSLDSLYLISTSSRKTNNSSHNSSSQQHSVAAATCSTPSSEPSSPCLQAEGNQQHEEVKQQQERTQQHHEGPDEHPGSFLTFPAAATAAPLQPTQTPAGGPYGLPISAAEYLIGVSNRGNSESSPPDLPPEALTAAARAMRCAPEEVRLARARLQEKQLRQQQQQERLQQRVKGSQQQRRSVNTLPARPQLLQKSTRKCRLDEGSYYTFKSAKVNGVTVELKNRGEVAASIHRLHCEYGVPLCREFGFRYFFLAEQHPLHRKAGSVIRKPLNNIKERLDELQLKGLSKKGSNNENQGRSATGAVSNGTKWSYCIRIRMRKLQKPQELLQLPTQLGIFFHELAHLRHMNHGLGFACLLARIFRYATERGLFEPGWETELPSPWLWERVLFYCGGFVTDTLLQQLLLADPKARAAAGAACNLDAPPSASAAEGEQTPDASSPAVGTADSPGRQAAPQPASTDVATAEVAPAADAACRAGITRRLSNSHAKQESAQGSAKVSRVQQQKQQVQRQRRVPPSFTLRQRTSRGSVGYPQKATARTSSSCSSSSKSNDSTTGPQRVLGKFFPCANPIFPTRCQQRQQKLQQSHSQGQQQQELVKQRSSISSSSISSANSGIGSRGRNNSKRRSSRAS